MFSIMGHTEYCGVLMSIILCYRDIFRLFGHSYFNILLNNAFTVIIYNIIIY